MVLLFDVDSNASGDTTKLAVFALVPTEKTSVTEATKHVLDFIAQQEQAGNGRHCLLQAKQARLASANYMDTIAKRFAEKNLLLCANYITLTDDRDGQRAPKKPSDPEVRVDFLIFDEKTKAELDDCSDFLGITFLN